MTTQTNEMTVNQAQNRLGEILGILYWHERGTFPVDNADELDAERAQIIKNLNANAYPPERNSRGNVVERTFASVSRYPFDFNMPTGWRQYDTDQDAHYYGVWYNPQSRQTLSYTEGDIVLVTCKHWRAFIAEMQSMDAFHGAPPAAWTVIDTAEHTVTGYTDEQARYDYSVPEPAAIPPTTMSEVYKIFTNKQ